MAAEKAAAEKAAAEAAKAAADLVRQAINYALTITFNQGAPAQRSGTGNYAQTAKGKLILNYFLDFAYYVPCVDGG